MSRRASSWPGRLRFIVRGFRFQVVLVEVVVVRFLVFIDVFLIDIQGLVVLVGVVVLIAVLIVSAPSAPPKPGKRTHWLARPIDSVAHGVADVFE